MGRLDVDRMLSEMTTEQFNEWIEYGELEPFGMIALAKMLASLAQANVGDAGFDADKLMRAWGFDIPERIATEEDVEEELEALYGKPR